MKNQQLLKEKNVSHNNGNSIFNYLKQVLYFSFLTLTILGCNSNKVTSQNIVENVREINVQDSSLAFRCQIVELPFISDKNLLNEIYSCMSVNKEYWVFTDYSKEGLNKAIQHHMDKLVNEIDRSELLKHYEQEFGVKNFVEEYGMLDDISLKIFSVNQNLVTLEYTFLGHRGGVGWDTKNYITFDLEKEKVIKIKDILKAGEELKGLSDILRKYVVTQNSCLNEEPIPLSEVYFLNNNSITFVYNTYEIACGADGIINITVPFEVLNNYLKEDFKQNYLKIN